MRKKWLLGIILCGVLFAACGDDDAETPPVVPTGVFVTQYSTTNVTVSWTAVANATNYEVYRTAAGGTAVLVGTTTMASFKDFPPRGETAYSYQVKAKNALGESVLSAAASGGRQTRWTVIGSAGFTEGNASEPQITVDQGIPYILFIDSANGNGLTLMKWNGTAWSVVGTKGYKYGTDVSISWPHLGVHAGVPWIAYAEYYVNHAPRVISVDGGVYSNHAPSNLSLGEARYMKMVLDETGAPCVFFNDVGDSGKSYVKRYAGGSWSVTGTSNMPPINYIGSFCVSNQVAYVNTSTNPGYPTGNVWRGGADGWTCLTGGLQEQIGGMVLHDGAPYVLSRYTAALRYASGGAWNDLAPSPFVSTNPAYTAPDSPQFDFDGATPVVVYGQQLDGGHARWIVVKKWNGTAWVESTTRFTPYAWYPTQGAVKIVDGLIWIFFSDPDTRKGTVIRGD